MWIDAHAHVDRYELVGEGALQAALAEIQQLGVLTISNSMDPASYERNLAIAAQNEWVLPIFGVHPWNAPAWAERLDELAQPVRQSPMLGEIGLDFCFVRDAAQYPAQRTVLEFFLCAAEEQGKVVHLHTKGAEDTILELLQRYDLPRVVVHWYSGPLGVLRRLADRGTFFTMGIEPRYSDHLRHIVQEIPDSQLLTETDNPGGPKGMIGGPGHPGLIKEVVDTLAHVKHSSPEEICALVRANLTRLIASDPWLRVRRAKETAMRTDPWRAFLRD